MNVMTRIYVLHIYIYLYAVWVGAIVTASYHTSHPDRQAGKERKGPNNVSFFFLHLYLYHDRGFTVKLCLLLFASLRYTSKRFRECVERGSHRWGHRWTQMLFIFRHAPRPKEILVSGQIEFTTMASG